MRRSVIFAIVAGVLFLTPEILPGAEYLMDDLRNGAPLWTAGNEASARCPWRRFWEGSGAASGRWTTWEASESGRENSCFDALFAASPLDNPLWHGYTIKAVL